jgi:hypothetical protein
MLCWPTTALSEVKKIDAEHVSMHVDEYRFFITRIKVLETEGASLKQILRMERASFDEVVRTVNAVDKARQEEREAADARIKELEVWIKNYKTARRWPGVVLGGGIGSRGKPEGFVGLGWRVGF